MIEVSVIIPTYNRKHVLEKALRALFSQTYPRSSYEVVVVDDGSSDGTEGVVKSLMERAPGRLRYVGQEKRGPAAARNLGIKEARGKLLLLLGDDVIAEHSLLEEHASWHAERMEPDLAVLGFTAWHPEVRRTPFIQYLDATDIQFAYCGIENPEDLGYQYFYSSNISVRREFLLKNGIFDEDFQYAAYEDSELGYRLKKRGLRIVLNRRARAYHLHQVTFSSFRRRQRLAGYSAALFHRKHPEVEDILIQDLEKVFGVGSRIPWEMLKLRTREALTLLQEWLSIPQAALPLNLSSAYGILLKYHYYLGVGEGFRSIQESFIKKANQRA